MGQQAAVGRAPEDGRGQQQRRMEPAAVLVMAFQVKVGLGALVVVHVGVRAAHHMPEGGAGVEPDFEDVGALGVVHGFLGAQDVLGRHAAPGLDAALLNHGGGLVDDLHGARMQFAAVLVQEEGQGPAALARDAPVGPAGDHVPQAGLAVLRVELGVLDGFQRDLAQRLRGLVTGLGEHALALIHADEPLGGGAVDHRRLVAPAVRVAVGDGRGIQQAVAQLERIDDDGDGLPDVLAAEQRQLGCVDAVALHGAQDVIARHAVVHAAVEVVHAVGGAECTMPVPSSAVA